MKRIRKSGGSCKHKGILGRNGVTGEKREHKGESESKVSFRKGAS